MLDPSNLFGDGKVDQDQLDRLAEALYEALGPQGVVDHTARVYDATAEYYDTNPHTQKVVPELPRFMDLLSEDALVLDLGCGHGRDSLYMVSPQDRARLQRKGSGGSGRVLRVVPYDLSAKLLDKTLEKLVGHMDRVPAVVQGDFSTGGYMNIGGRERESMAAALGEGSPLFDGIWACASFLIHTPLERVSSAVGYWSGTLKTGGVFAVSYINPALQDLKCKFKISRTGDVKPFVRPSVEDIHLAFEAAGLSRLDAGISDLEDQENVQKDFFISETYRKA